MKKKRVLALLLALSLAVGMNDMTVLAFGQRAPEQTVILAEGSSADDIHVSSVDSAGAAREEQTEPGGGIQKAAVAEETGVTGDGGSSDNQNTPDQPDGNDDANAPGASDGTDDTNAPGQSGDKDDANTSDQPGGKDNTNTPGGSEDKDGINTPENPDDTGDTNTPAQPGDKDDTDTPAQPGDKDDTNTPEDPDHTGDVDDAKNPDPAEDEDGLPEDGESGEEEPAGEEEKDPTEELPDAAVKEARMVTFTDDTGMKITYNVNEEYDLTITDGVLEAITYADGKPVSGVVAVPSGKGITAIGSAFKGNDKITYVRLPAGVTSLQDDAFNNCYNLQGIYLPNGMQTIGNNAFYRCTGLLKVAVPKQVASIGNGAFYGNTKLFMVYMQDADYSDLVSIGDQAFYECRVLEQFCSDQGFVIPGKLETIGTSAFYGCRSIKAIDFHESVKSIGESAFQGCNSLRELVLSSQIETIPKNAFSGCDQLYRVQFKQGNKIIGESAFEGCLKLGGLVLPGSVASLGNYAFFGCTSLTTVEVKNSGVVYGDSVFPNLETLTLRSTSESTTEEYTIGKKIKFVAYDTDNGYYLYKISCMGDVGSTSMLQIKDADGKDPNTLNKNQGVSKGTKLYVYDVRNESQKSLFNFSWSSVKCNGEPLLVEKGETDNDAPRYYFLMPIGGALITVEYESVESSKKIRGTADDVTVEISNGDVITNAKGEVVSINLKAGQYTRMFLTDAKDDNKAVPSHKITFASEKKSVATVTEKGGVIHAVNEGYTTISAKVTGGDEQVITKTIRVDVTPADVTELRLKADGYDASKVDIVTNPAGDTQTATIDKNRLGSGMKFQLKAAAYDADGDNVAVKLQWSSTDSKVAKLSAASTAVDNPNNTVTIPAGTTGEATIRVSATNADKKTITQKFVIRVIDVTPRLVSNNLTVNPMQTEGAVLQIVSAYGRAVDQDKVKLVKIDSNNVQTECRDFDFTYLPGESDNTVTAFRITPPLNKRMDNGTWSLFVDINNGAYDLLPVKITVKNSEPKPKVAFEKKQPKLNLWYANDGTEFKINVSGLGNDAVSDYQLFSLADDKDKLFEQNFEVEYVSRSSCVIIQKSNSLLYNSKKKPVVTGTLRLYFEGYVESVYKDFKITIPTQTVKPAYKLNRTSDTFHGGCEAQQVELQLLNNKKQPADLSDGGYHLQVVDGSGTGNSNSVEACDVDETGRITLTLKDNPRKGKVNLMLTNDAWADGQKLIYTYTIKLSGSAPSITLTDGPSSTVKLKSSTVTLNQSYPEQEVLFGLTSNQKDTVIAEEQEFERPANLKQTAMEQYDKLNVEYIGGAGRVSIIAEDIKDGTYTYVCKNAKYVFAGGEQPANKVTLKVKVKKGVPTVSVKGSASLNNTARTEGNDFAERQELTLVTKNLPEDYQFDEDATLSSIVCTTKNRGDYAERFEWELIERQVGEDGKLIDAKLAVTMLEWCEKGTYKFSILPTFTGNGNTIAVKKRINFNVKVHDGEIYVTLAAKGKLNLLDRFGECTASNSIIYTPKLNNVKDKVIDARVFDYDQYAPIPTYDSEESAFFEARVSADGKVYIIPKEDARLENGVSMKIKIWMELENYKFGGEDGGGTFCNKVLTVKTAQVLPKVITDRSTVNLYLSNKDYVATFIVGKKDEKAVGNVESIAFGEKDTKAQESFVTTEDDVTGKETIIESEQLEDGSLRVKLKLRDTQSYSGNSTNKITMYVRFAGQGTNTPGTAVTMNVKINK